ncbi:MAG: hypothetical protein V3T33_07805 [Myxococcota bacterium]
MPRDLSDVLHYFMPESEPAAGTPTPLRPERNSLRPAARHPAALPLIGVPLGAQDVVRAAFTWNLTVEIARLGGRAILIAPDEGEPSSLWPESGLGPMGAEIIRSDARNLVELHRKALDVAVARAPEANEGGVVFVRIPPTWIADFSEDGSWLRWTLLFSSGDSRDLLETYGVAKLLFRAHSNARVGVVIHGAQRIGEAERAFARLARSTERNLGRSLESYGLLVDDLHVYRAIVAQRPIGLAHPQSPAARSLRDVAGMVLDDARERALV